MGRSYTSLLNVFAFFVLSAVFLSSPNCAFGQLPSEVSGSTRVSLLTIYPGEPTYSAWGHSALRILDPETGLDASFNYGTFDTTVPYFIPRFAYGDMLYQLSVGPTSALLRGANFQERAVIEQDLRLDSVQIGSLYALLLDNMLPQNRAYQYDFVFDNCSTRILDLLIEVDAVKLPDDDPYGTTFRDMLDEFVHDRAALDLGIDLVIGSPLDRIPTMRERTFLPTYLMEILDQSTDTAGNPMILAERTLLSFDDEASSSSVPWTVWVATILAVGLLTLGFRKRSYPAWLDRWLLGLIGFVGLFLLLMWFATLHHVTSANWNIAWALPSHFFVAIFWRRLSWTSVYLKWAAYWTVGVMLLQFVVPQAIPIAMWPVVCLLSVRLAWAGAAIPGPQEIT